MRRWFGGMLFLSVLGLAAPAAAQSACEKGTVASYAGTSCVLGGVVYKFPADDYSYTGSGIQPIPASEIRIFRDPNGPYTLLFRSPRWVLTGPHQSFSVDIKFQVTGATITAGWQHGALADGDAKVSESTTVEGSPDAVSSSFRTASDGLDRARMARFPDGTRSVVVNIAASVGQHGSASLRSYGTHFGRPEDLLRHRTPPLR